MKVIFKKKRDFEACGMMQIRLCDIRIYTFLPDRCDYLRDLRICISLFFFLRSAICFCCAAQMFFSLRFPPHFVPTNFLCQETKEVDGKPSTKIHACLGIKSMVRCFVHHSYRSRFPLPKKTWNFPDFKHQTILTSTSQALCLDS